MSDASAPTSESTSTEPEPEDPGRREKGLEAGMAALRKRAQQAEAELEAYKLARQQEEAQAAEKRGEFEKLYTELKRQYDPLAEQYKLLSEREQARVDALTAANVKALQALPEGVRHLVPEGLDAEAMAKQIRAVQLLVVSDNGLPRGGVRRGEGPEKGEEKIPEAALQEARALGYSDDNVRSYYERVYKPRQERRKKGN